MNRKMTAALLGAALVAPLTLSGGMAHAQSIGTTATDPAADDAAQQGSPAFGTTAIKLHCIETTRRIPADTSKQELLRITIVKRWLADGKRVYSQDRRADLKVTTRGLLLGWKKSDPYFEKGKYKSWKGNAHGRYHSVSHGVFTNSRTNQKVTREIRQIVRSNGTAGSNKGTTTRYLTSC